MEDRNEIFYYIKKSFDLKNQKLYKEAIELLYKVLSDDIDRATTLEVLSQIGDLHFILKNYERAIEEYEHVLELDSTHEHSKDSLYDIYFAINKYDKALSIIEEKCVNSKNPLDFVKYFSVLLKLKKTDLILQKYNELSDELKSNPEIMYIISLLSADDNKKKDFLEKIIKAEPTFIEAIFDLALIYYNQDNDKKAEELFNNVLKLKKDSLSYYYKALIQIKRKEFFPAIDSLHGAIRSSKGRIPEFYFELAKTYMDINWFDEAITTIKNSITLYIKNGIDKNAIDRSYLFLAWAFEKQNDYDNALFNLSLIDLNSIYNTEAEILRALIMYKKGSIVEAKNKFEQLYEKKEEAREDLTLISTLGSIYRDLKLNNKAKEFYEKHLEKYPDSIHTVCEYVDLLIDIEEYDRAEEFINKYNSYGKIVSFLNSKARIAYRKKDYKAALNSLDELLMYDKNNAEGYYFKGLILNQKGDYLNALKYTKTALELNPTPAKYYAQAAYSNMYLENYSEAILYIKEAIEIEPYNLNYKKLAAEISQKAGKPSEAEFWNSIVNRTENIIKENKRF